MAIYTILVYTAVQKTGLRECYDKIFWSTTFTAKPHVVRKYASRLLMGLPKIKVSILAQCAMNSEETAFTVYSHIVG